MSSVIDYLRWYHESDADGDTMDTAELAVAYAKHCLSEELREVFAIHKAEIDALKAQRDALLAAQQWQPIESAPKDGTDFLIDYEGVTIARWQPDGSQHPWIFLDTDDGKFIFNRLRENVEGLVWRHKPLGWEAIAKARGDL